MGIKMFKKYFIRMIFFGLIFILTGCSGPVIKIPKTMPDNVSAYKSVIVQGSHAGIFKSGIEI